MKISPLLFLLLVIGLSVSAQSKLEIGAVIQENQITSFSQQKLILLDFWATWCGPCIPAARQLEVYQEQLKGEVYMIGISDENENKIRQFVERQDFKMAIYQDHDFFNVKMFEIPYRPYSVLLNGKGEMLWKGSPSKLSVHKLLTFARKESYRSYELEDIFNFIIAAPAIAQFSEIDTVDIFVSKIKEKKFESHFVKTDTRVYYQGDLVHLFDHLLNLPATNFQTNLDINVRLGANAAIWEHEKDRLITYLNNQLNLKLSRSLRSVQSSELVVENASLLWDTNQIDWGNDSANDYIIGDQRIEADNLTLKEISTLLSEAKNQPFIYRGSDNKEYDWNFHYHFDNLMMDELLYQFGITIKQGQAADMEIIEIKNSNS